MKTRANKTEDLELLRGEFSGAESAFLISFAGLDGVSETALRKQVREKNGHYRVVKNSLARAASEGTILEGLKEHFKGGTAVVRATDDVPGVAKALADFAKDNPAVQLKAGVVDGLLLNSAQCQEIATIPSREELLTKLAFLLQSPMQRLVTVLQAPSRGLAVALAQVAEKKGG